MEVRGPAPPERFLELVVHPERGRPTSQSLRAEVPVRLLARLNGDELEPWRPTGRS